MSYFDVYEQWVHATEMSKADGAELYRIARDSTELKECFAVGLEFGTAGMRGVLGLGTNRMNIWTVKRATKGLADYIDTLGDEAKARGVAVSYDTRRMSTEFACAVARVLSHRKIKVYLMEDVRPVPMLSYAVRSLNAMAGVMITASHNPKRYNGYKVYGEDGAQMSPEATAVVVDFIEKSGYFGIEEADTELSAATIRGKDGYEADDFVTILGKTQDDRFFAELEKLSLSPEAVAKVGGNIKIVYTPIHGSGYMPVTTMLDRMHIKVNVVEEQKLPDPDFSTVPVPNPEDAGALKMALALADKIGSDVVIGTDPDCDRMGVAVRDDKGEFKLLNGNQIGTLLCDYILSRNAQKGTLPANSAVVKTIVTTNLANKVCAEYGATVFDVLTGFKFIGEKIKEWEQSGEYTYMFGFEESYGYLSGTHARDKDAVVASMLFAEMVCWYEYIGSSVFERLQQIYRKHGFFVEKSVSIVYGGLDGMDKMKAIMEKLRKTDFTAVCGRAVVCTEDYQTGEVKKSNGEIGKTTLPKTNAIKLFLESGDWLCVRPSGTEPKLKIYSSVSAADMPTAQATADAYIAEMSALL